MSHDALWYGGVLIGVAPAPIIGLIARTPLQAVMIGGITGSCLFVLWWMLLSL